MNDDRRIFCGECLKRAGDSSHRCRICRELALVAALIGWADTRDAEDRAQRLYGGEGMDADKLARTRTLRDAANALEEQARLLDSPDRKSTLTVGRFTNGNTKSATNRSNRVNPFDLMAKFEEFKEFGNRVQAEISPDWLIRTAFAAAMRFVLTSAKTAGPPSGFGEALKLDPPRAKRLYDAVLDAAISRHTPRVGDQPALQKVETENAG